MTAPERGLRCAILGINYAPEEIGIARYTSDMAVALARRGHAVEVVAGAPYYPQWRVYAGYRGGWRRSAEHGVHITRCPLYVPANPTGLRRIVHLASFAISAAGPALGWALRRRAARPQVVIAVAPALLAVPVAWAGARLAGAKLWVHVQDFEVEAAFATGLVAGGGWLARLARGFENRVLRLADRVSTISPQMCAKLANKGVPAQGIVELRNWADGAIRPDPTCGAAYRAQWALGDAQVALYSGNVANKQGIDLLVEVARLLAHRSDLIFVICGQGPNRAALEAMAAGLPNVRFFDLQPAARMGELLGLATIHLLPQMAGAADLVLPSKLTNMLASGRPVVATALPGTGLYDEVAGCGLATAPGDARAMAAAITRLLDDPAARAALGEAACRRAEERWSQAAIVARLDAALRDLCRRAPA